MHLCSQSIFPMIGINHSITNSPDSQVPYTDGDTIYLPRYFSFFNDPKQPLEQNRNTSIYISCAIHEAGHIFAGSFEYDWRKYLHILDDPQLYHQILNTIEDFRIEQVIVQYCTNMNENLTIEELILKSNVYFHKLRCINGKLDTTVRFLDYLTAVAQDIFGQIESLILKENPTSNAIQEWKNVLQNDFYAGPYKNLTELAHDTIEKWKSMDIRCSLESMRLARELYEIMKFWPPDSFEDQELMSKGKNGKNGKNGRNGKNGKPDGGIGLVPDRKHNANSGPPNPERTPTPQEINQMMEEFKQNPEKFLEDHGLKKMKPFVPPQKFKEKPPPPPDTPIKEIIETSQSGSYADDSQSGNGLMDSDDPDTVSKDGQASSSGNQKGSPSHSKSADADSKKDNTGEKNTDGKSKNGEEQDTKKDKASSETSNPRSVQEFLYLFDEEQKKNPNYPPQPSNAASIDETGKGYVFNIDPKNKTRPKSTKIETFYVSDVDPGFMDYFKQWNHVVDAAYRMLANIVPQVEEEHDFSAYDGEMNIEKLIELLSDKNAVQVPEFLDIYKPSQRSMEVIIGLDLSGSTQGIKLNIEKTFALILGNALSYLSPKVSILGFNSTAKQTNIYKATHLKAVSSFHSDVQNHDGAFIKYVLQVLTKSTAEVKYFILLCDGDPSISSTESPIYETITAMRECVNAGVKLLYFNINTRLTPNFKLFKQEATYAKYYSHPEQLLPSIPELVRTISKSIQ